MSKDIKNISLKNATGFVLKTMFVIYIKKLRDLDDYTDWLRDKNLTDKNEIVKTVALVFNKSSERQEVFWWINLIEWETIEVPKMQQWVGE